MQIFAFANDRDGGIRPDSCITIIIRTESPKFLEQAHSTAVKENQSTMAWLMEQFK
jgi:hypothetical protein